jgi:TolB-like protein/tetratricopeptide (TPR) repeat protein
VSDGPDPAQVLTALDEVLASEEFRRSSSSREFLAYVVTETLAGRAGQLSERTVGRRALGQGADFDGRATASVRVRASRVRRALDRYYAGAGADAPLRIAIPSGRYVPTFDTRPSSPALTTTSPGVAVVSLAATGGELAGALAASLSSALTQRLGGYPHILVVGPTVMVDGVRGTGTALGVSSVLDGEVVEHGDVVTVSVRLSDTRTGGVVWAVERALSASDLTGFATEDEWAGEIAAHLGDATGVVVRQELARTRPTVTDERVAAQLAFYSYVDRGSVESLTRASELLDRALSAGERPADLLAMRAASANAAQAFGVADREHALDLAVELAREALSNDGGNAHAHLVLASVAHYRGDWDVALEHAKTAVALAPRHPSYLVGAGNTLCGSGEWEQGAALIREAQRLHPGLTGRTHTWLAVAHLVRRDHARALVEASWLPADGGFFWGPLYRAMALAGLGHLERARAEIDRARAMRADVVDDPDTFFESQMRLTHDQRHDLVTLVRTAVQGPAETRSDPG